MAASAHGAPRRRTQGMPEASGHLDMEVQVQVQVE